MEQQFSLMENVLLAVILLNILIQLKDVFHAQKTVINVLKTAVLFAKLPSSLMIKVNALAHAHQDTLLIQTMENVSSVELIIVKNAIRPTVLIARVHSFLL